MAPKDFIEARNNNQITIVDGKPYYPSLIADPDQDASVLSSALKILLHDSSLSDESIKKLEDCLTLKKVTGGITNNLFQISGFIQDVEDVPFDFNSCLVRVFGAEGMIDRDVETCTFAHLANADIAPRYLGRGSNFRVEGWLDRYSPLGVLDLQQRANSEKVAVQMAKLHSFQVPDELKEWHDEKKPAVWDQLYAWLQQAKDITTYKTQGDDARSNRLINLDTIEKELNWVKDNVVPADASVAFCHNDALAANIMKHDETGEVRLIDFEYGGVNFIGFDIANHFNEYAGGTDKKNGEPDYSLLPDEIRQKGFITTYVQARRNLGKKSEVSEDDEVDILLNEVKGFVLVNHLYWGLWAVNQAANEGTESFDYIAFSHHRFQQYLVEKEENYK
jgi:ethanolamine kinase